jgi:hypothetical protein
LTQVKRYRTAIKNESEWDYWEFQNIRDELAEALLYFGPHYAKTRQDSELAEVERKALFAERRIHWKEHYKSVRGTASLAEDKATLDCKDIMAAEAKANHLYYQARSIVERVDQVLNGIASRLKPIEKYDKND